MLEELKKKVYEANMLLPAYHLVTFTWGNVSGIDREKGLFVIKPSGVPYEELKPEDMVVIDLEGKKVEGDMNPSSDTPTHADYLYGNVPCCRDLTKEEVERAYELETGRVIASHFEDHGINPNHMPCVLARHHGPFAWGKDALEAVHNAVVLEEVAMMAWHTEALPQEQPRENLPEYVKEKHFMRKHGPNAYYGQKKV